MGKVADVIGGGTPEAKDPANFAPPGTGISWLTPADLSGFGGIRIERGKRDLSPQGLRSSSARLLPAGTVLMSSRAPIGYVALAQGEIATNQGFKSFVCHRDVVPEFVFYWLRFIEPLLQELGSGSTFAEISGSRAKEIPLLVAPTSEQKTIVAALDPLMEGVKSSAKILARVPGILRLFRRSVLTAACSGRLTEDWRESNRAEPGGNASRMQSAEPPDSLLHELPESWSWAEAGGAYTDARYGTSVKCSRISTGGIPVLRVPNIARGQLDLTDLKYADVKGEWASLLLMEGDILVCRTNGSLDLIGKAALVPPLDKPHAFASYLIRLRLDRSILDPAYLHAVLSSPIGRGQIEERARTTAGQFNLNLAILRGLAVPVAPLGEQIEIVRRIRAMFSLADAIERRLARAAARTHTITQAILAKAFRGALVPTERELAVTEGRSYEAAAELLERIRREREGGATTDVASTRARPSRPRARPLAASPASRRQRTETLRTARAKRG